MVVVEAAKGMGVSAESHISILQSSAITIRASARLQIDLSSIPSAAQHGQNHYKRIANTNVE
jgi:hypothetical protein